MTKNELIKKILDSEEQELFVEILTRDRDGFVIQKQRASINHIRTTVNPLAICVESSKLIAVNSET